MATGFTFGVREGTITDFRTFALRCARAIDYIAGQRDEDINISPKRREVNDWFIQSVKNAEADVKKFNSMTLEQATTASQLEYEEKVKQHSSYIMELKQYRERYTKMLMEVESWEPPSDEHVNLKKFMIDQLKDSIEFDCTEKYYNDPVPLPDPVKWLSEQRDVAVKSLQWAQERLKNEQESCRATNEWVDKLYASLG